LVPFLGDLPLFCLFGDPDGESVLIGEDSRSSLPTKVFWTDTLELNFINGSFRSIFSSSAGVYWSKNSSIDKNPPPTRTIFFTSQKLTVDFVLVNSDVDSFTSKLVNTFWFSHKHDLKSIPLWVVVNVLSQFFVYGVVFNRNVDCDSLLELDDILFKRFDFLLSVFKLFEEFKWLLGRFFDSLLALMDVVTRILKFLFKHLLLRSYLLSQLILFKLNFILHVFLDFKLAIIYVLFCWYLERFFCQHFNSDALLWQDGFILALIFHHSHMFIHKVSSKVV